MFARRFCSVHWRTLPFRGRSVDLHSTAKEPLLVLGIETSCDDTGAAILDENGKILGEALHSQNEFHLKTGGIIPAVAQKLHADHIDRVVNETLSASGLTYQEISAIATTVMPGLALSLGVGVSYSLNLVKQYSKPFIPIHHMEAHALTVRLLHQVEFPFLVLLISGGHCILAVAKNLADFLVLGQSQDEAPGESLDKVARRLSLINNPDCSTMSGGQAIEHMAQFGNRELCKFRIPMSHHRDCNFSFSGLRNHINYVIQQKESEEGIQQGQILSCAADIAAASQHTVARQLAKRTQRAILFCKENGLLPAANATLVVSGGVASNGYIRRALKNVSHSMDVALLCPPPKLCTDNGVMIAWNGIERLRAGVGILYNAEEVRYEPRAPLGTDISDIVRKADIPLPSLKKKLFLDIA